MVLLLFVVWVYSGAVAHGRMPPGHPWSGVTLTLLGVMPLVWPSPLWREQSRTSRILLLIVAVLSLLGGVLWVLSALAARPPNLGL